MPKGSIFYLLIIVAIIILVVVIKESKKSLEHERWKKQEEAKQNAENAIADKFKSNEKVQEWAIEISNLISPYIIENAFRDTEFQFKTFTSCFEFGRTLQNI